MKKISYNKALLPIIENDFRNLFQKYLEVMQSHWEPLRDYLRTQSRSIDKLILYPDNVESYFCMSFTHLVDVYLDYYDCMGTNSQPKDSKKHMELKKIFNYSGIDDAYIPAMQPEIADFFMNHEDDLDVHVCHYCEMSYINAYGFNGVYVNFGKFLLNESKEKIRHYIRKTDGNFLSPKTISKILKLRLTSTESSIVDDFDNLSCWANLKGKKSDSIKASLKNHFDLDHFLPKSECPLVALSLYNFVPSCSVCNEKLKGADRIGDLDKSKILRLSPTSSAYKFDEEVSINIIPLSGSSLSNTLKNPQNYRLEFLPKSNEYQPIVDEFCLEERYNYHKLFALRDFDLYQNYSPAVIKMFESIMNGSKTATEIEEDIFGVEFLKNNNRCFDKLKRDVRKQSGR